MYKVEWPGGHGKRLGALEKGFFYEEKCRLMREVRKRVNFCAAREERRRVQRRERMFQSGNRYRFCRPIGRGGSRGFARTPLLYTAIVHFKYPTGPLVVSRCY